MFLTGISGDVVDYPVGRPRQRARAATVPPSWDGGLFKRFWLPSRGLAGEYTEADRAFAIWVFKYALGLGR